MSIKLRILLFQIILGLTVVLMAGLAYVAITALTSKLESLRWTRLQLDATTQLAVVANRYSEQIAEMLLVGESERPDFDNARAEMVNSLQASYDLRQQQIATLRNGPARAEEQRELTRIEQMRSLFRQIDRAVERLLFLDQEGRRQEAVALFRSEIENRLDADLERLIAAAVADERTQAARADGEAMRLAGRLTLATAAAALIILVTILALGVQFYGAIAGPLRTLTEGALAIGRGDLGHRVPAHRSDELAKLASHFNQMAEELQRQRELLLAARTGLERQVSERTAQLADANRRLTELDAHRVRFLAEVSHELRTPLTVLRGEAEVALRGSSRPERMYRQALELIVKQASDMGRLVEDLLFLARSEADEIRFDFSPVRLGQVVREAVSDASAIAQGRQIRLSLDPLPAELVVRADARRLKQVVLTVLDNAIKYSPPNTTVDIGLEFDDGMTTLTVTNGGDPVPAEQVPHVFERFFRGDNARVKGVSGSGLGLAIAHRIVEKHGGELSMTSEPGLGTTVTMNLPRLT
jgi:signal transduction histidine kinase